MPALTLPKTGISLDFTRMNEYGGDSYADYLSVLSSFGLNFARASTKTRFNPSGLLETVASGQPALDFNPKNIASRGLRLDGQRTNLLLRSNELGTSPWNPVGITSAASGTAFGLTRLLFTETSASGYHLTQQAVTIATGVNCLWGIFKGNGRNVCLGFEATPEVGRVFNLADGTSSMPASLLTTAPDDFGSESLGGGYWLCWITKNTAATIAYVFLANGSAINYQGGGSAGAFAVMVQCEAGARPSAYIPTTTAAVTRVADALSLSVGSWYNPAEGTWAIEVEPDMDSHYCLLSGFDGTTTLDPFVAVYPDSPNVNRIWYYGATGIVLPMLGSPISPRLVLANTYDGSRLAGVANWGTVLSSFVGAFPPPPPVSMFIGADHWSLDATWDFYGWVRRLTYVPRAVPDLVLKHLLQK